MKFEDHVKNYIHKHPNADVRLVRLINKEIDQFAHFPNWETLQRHRKFLHHKEGIEYFGILYGEMGADIAKQHVLDDIGHIPEMIDYHIGVVDMFGRKL